MDYWSRNEIKLRAFTENDFSLSKGDDFTKNQWYYDIIEFPQCEIDLKKDFEEMYASNNKNDKKMLAIETLDGSFVGSLLVWYAEKKYGVFRYGITLSEKFRGMGYGKDALVILLDYYFNELGYNKCASYVYCFNKASQSFHEKFGFLKEAVLREELYTRGAYQDILYYSILKNEFNNKYFHFISCVE